MELRGPARFAKLSLEIMNVVRSLIDQMCYAGIRTNKKKYIIYIYIYIYLKAHAPRPPPCLMHMATAVLRLPLSAAGQATVDMSTSGWLMCGGEGMI